MKPRLCQLGPRNASSSIALASSALISAGDGVMSKPGGSNSKNGRVALEALKQRDITVRVWGATRGQRIGAAAAAEGFVQHRGHPYPHNDLLAELFGKETR